MNEYWCKEHNIQFFKKGKMKGFAHPIEDTGLWCNMPEGQEPIKEESPPSTDNGKPDGMTPDMWAEKQKVERLSIETQTAFKGIMEAFAAGKLDKDLILVQAALDWAMIRLGGQVLASKPDPKPVQKVSSKPTGQQPEGSKVDLASMVFKDAGALKNYMQNNLGMGTMQISALTAGCILTTEEGLAECWASILETREEGANE